MFVTEIGSLAGSYSGIKTYSFGMVSREIRLENT